MSHRLGGRLAVLGAAVLVGLVAGADDEVIQEPTAEEAVHRTDGMVHGAPDGGAAAFLMGDGGRFEVGEPIAFAYGLINVNRVGEDGSREAVSVVRPMPAFDPHNGSWFSVIGPDGEELPYKGPYVSWGAIKEDQKLSLWPGEFAGRTMEVNLLFDFSRPGEYRVRWHHGWDGAGLVSNEVGIEVAPASGIE